MRTRSFLLTALGVLHCGVIPLSIAQTVLPQTTDPSESEYYNNGFGWKTEALHREDVSPSLSHALPAREQMLKRVRGVSTSEETMRLHHPNEEDMKWEVCSSKPLHFMPYLDGLYVFGNTCVEPGAVIEEDNMSTAAQRLKSELAHYGITYAINHGFGYSGVVGQLVTGQHRRNFPVYNFNIQSNITLLRQGTSGEGLFLATDLVYGPGFGFKQQTLNPSTVMGSSQNPEGWYNYGNAYFQNFSLGYATCGGKLMLMVGQIDMSNYVDTNAYCAPFDNDSIENNAVLPLANCGWGYQVAWQPTKSFYLLATSTSNNTPYRHNPFDYISSHHQTTILELGLISKDVAGLGPGTYRFQPFFETSPGHDGGGISTNFQQQLGKNSTLGWYFRGGWADNNAATLTGIQASMATGILWMTPYSKSSSCRILRSANNGCMGVGFVFQRGAPSNGPFGNRNEYGLELSYTLQMTPTMVIKPDLQIIQNPINGKHGQTNLVLQVHNVWTW